MPPLPEALIPYLIFTMVSRFSILTNLLLVSTALAVQPSRLGARLARHHENRQSKFSSDIELRDADYMTTNSTTWAGAVWVDSFVCIVPIHDHP